MTHVTGMVGTAAWTAPEVLQGQETMRSSADVYGFGVILWEILREQLPWHGMNMVQIITAVVVQGRSLSMPADGEQLQSFPPDVRELITSCLSATADRRPSFDVLYNMLHAMLVPAMRAHDEALGRCPDAFLCPITFEMMNDPVICADGHSYEREAITEWLQQSRSSPKTNLELPNRRLIPNVALRAAIEGFRERSPR